MQQHPAPAAFNDSVALRAQNLRFRGIGNPYAFLNGIGIVPIKEFLFRGATIIELAETINLPVSTIRNWIEQEGHQNDIDEASTLSAEGYLVQGERMLRTAANKFELDRAKSMLEHGRWLASKRDKKTYGNLPGEQGGAAAVSYTFNIGADNAQINIAQQTNLRHKGEEDAPPPVTFDLNTFQIDGHKPDHLQKVHSDFPAIAALEVPEDYE